MNHKGRKVEYIAHAVRWFDRVNGNTYNSVSIVRAADGARLWVPFGYGYGDHYRQRALDAMLAAEWLPRRYTAENVYLWEREAGYPVLWYCVDGLKRECVQNGAADDPR